MAKSRSSRGPGANRSEGSRAKSSRQKPSARPAKRRKFATPLKRAQHLVQRAFFADDYEDRIELAQQALEASPDCAEAYTLLASVVSDPAQSLALCAEGVAAAQRTMDPRLFETGVGNFWAIPETRPYMQARLALAQELWSAGRRESAIEHLRDLLRLNPHDNQGIRYLYAARLLESGHDEALGRLLAEYDEPSAIWTFCRALAAFRAEGDTPKTRKLLNQARKLNRNIVPLLLEKPAGGPRPVDFYSPGDWNEAQVYINDFTGGWWQTPGAITWLRRVVAEPKSRKREAPVATGPTEAVKQRLRKLPQRFGAEWQAVIRRIPTWVDVNGILQRPWSFLAINHQDELILGQDLLPDDPTPEAVFDRLARTLEHPAIGEPHRPSEIQVRETPLWEAIRPHLEEIGVDCIYRSELEALDFVENHMREFINRDSPPGLVELPGVDQRQVASFFEAAADYFRRAPWRYVPSERAIRVECEQFHKHRRDPYYAVVMGQSNMTYGLAIYQRLETLQAMWWDEADPEDAMCEDESASVLYSEAFEIPIADLLACEAHNWPLASPEAYPLVICARSKAERREPKPWELNVLEGCLRSIPQFVERHSLLTDPAAETITVPTFGGNLVMQLSWTPDVPACGSDCDDCHDHCHDECGH